MDFSTFFRPLYACTQMRMAINCFYRVSPDTKRKLMMRIQLLSILLFTACLQISAAGFSQSITISEKNTSLETVLNKIEQQSGYDVFFQTELLAKSNKVTINIKNLSLDKALEKIFKEQPLSYAIVGHTIVLKEKAESKTVSGTNTIIAANIVTGKIVDADTKDPLIGATVTVKGTTKATFTGLDGTFKIDVAPSDGSVLVVTYVGYITKEITLTGNAQLGEIDLKPSANAMSEVVINGDVAIDRKTPIAASSISAQYIEEHVGSQDIPQLLKDIPGIMATAQGGGYGDSRVSIRGFSTGAGNVAETINGIPVNDPENGTIYWSDYSGLTDVATSIQVQRGLGASKIIVPSFGGTINITTRSTDAEKGGYVSETIGSDAYNKTSVLISSGLNDKGWATTFQGARTMGNGNADGLNFLGYNYFFNLSKVLSPDQTLSFSVMGASQTHGQRYQRSILEYQNAPQGIRWNGDLGVKDGQQINPSNNFFSKPLITLNHDWTINSNSSLSTVLYATYGTGGGGNYGGAQPPRVSNFYSPYDYTAVEKSNAASLDGSAGTYLYASHNDHSWYGIRSTYRTNITKYLDFSGGVDLRYYEGTHYQTVTDLLGADYVLFNYYGNPASGNSGGNINNPIERAVVGDKIYYYNTDYIASQGVFLQSEYSKNKFSAFVTLAGSGNEDWRKDYFNYLNSDPNQTSKTASFFTYQAKGGVNYNINSQMNIFANIGYLTKPPYFGNVFESFTNQINKSSVPEKLFSYELGYGFKSSVFSANLNLYRSLYKDETLTSPFFDQVTNQQYSVNVTGVDELHQGIELELKFRPDRAITIGGMASIGDWYFTQNAGPASVYNNQNKPVGTIDQVLLKGLKVGDAAQTTAALFLDVNVLPELKLGANYNFFGNYTSSYDFTTLTPQTLKNHNITAFTPYVLPNYSLFELNAVFKFKIAGLNASFIATVNNLFDTKYISDSFDQNALGKPENLSVYYGLGRTFTTGLKVKF